MPHAQKLNEASYLRGCNGFPLPQQDVGNQRAKLRQVVLRLRPGVPHNFLFARPLVSRHAPSLNWRPSSRRVLWQNVILTDWAMELSKALNLCRILASGTLMMRNVCTKCSNFRFQFTNTTLIAVTCILLLSFAE
eukprot:TRINITY_DN55133_c0_g1_i1.p2 TRINITY_DN55133_c0_g1~~TRINITY_DN55133_c0_g1_i1.p2  ORF type:complete len:135 (-),score=2.65 TRINITY_DN55133_c0_g1_i1:92-496(-)